MLSIIADETTTYAGWITAAVIAIGAITKAVIDISGMRFSQKQSDRDKAVASMEIVLKHTQDEMTKQAKRIDDLTEEHEDCERRSAGQERRIGKLEGILIRHGLLEDAASGPHTPIPHTEGEA